MSLQRLGTLGVFIIPSNEATSVDETGILCNKNNVDIINLT